MELRRIQGIKEEVEMRDIKWGDGNGVIRDRKRWSEICQNFKDSSIRIYKLSSEATGVLCFVTVVRLFSVIVFFKQLIV